MRKELVQGYNQDTQHAYSEFRITTDRNETIKSIARKLDTTPTVLLSHNNMFEDSDYKPRKGDQLRYFDHNNVMSVGVPLSDVANQVLITPMEDYRPSGPSLKEVRLYRKERRGRDLLEERLIPNK